MNRFALACLMTSLSACGDGIGLTPLDDAPLLSSQPESVEMTGRTYAAWLDEVVAIEPAGLGLALATLDAAALLLHVVAADDDSLWMVITVSDPDGEQDACEPVFSLPEAAWGAELEFSIDEGSFALPVGGQPMTLSAMKLTGRIDETGHEMESTVLSAEIDTRDLNGGAFGEDVEICILVEELGGQCHPCADGAEACTDLVLEMFPEEVDVDFDPTVSGCE